MPTTPMTQNFQRSCKSILKIFLFWKKKNAASRMKVSVVRVCAMMSVSNRVTMRCFATGAELPQNKTDTNKNKNPFIACEDERRELVLKAFNVIGKFSVQVCLFLIAAHLIQIGKPMQQCFFIGNQIHALFQKLFQHIERRNI